VPASLTDDVSGRLLSGKSTIGSRSIDLPRACTLRVITVFHSTLCSVQTPLNPSPTNFELVYGVVAVGHDSRMVLCMMLTSWNPPGLRFEIIEFHQTKEGRQGFEP
jgi:hypothetical protein